MSVALKTQRLLTANDAYAVRLATSAQEVHRAQQLRFAVFNLEMNEGLATSFVTGRDEDPFDAVCDHLIVEHCPTGAVVGTYRLQTGLSAARRLGYYSAQEFDFSPYEAIRDQTIELGRACVERNHRNLSVLGLLWKGIAQYATSHRAHYLIGCSSISSRDPAAGATVYADISRRHLAAPKFRTRPLPHFECQMHELTDNPPSVPKLLRAYLSLGARVCGPPAIDREFGSIDFLTLLDLDALPPQVRTRFLGQ
jgi:putative hemolysin